MKSSNLAKVQHLYITAIQDLAKFSGKLKQNRQNRQNRHDEGAQLVMHFE